MVVRRKKTTTMTTTRTTRASLASFLSCLYLCIIDMSARHQQQHDEARQGIQTVRLSGEDGNFFVASPFFALSLS